LGWSSSARWLPVSASARSSVGDRSDTNAVSGMTSGAPGLTVKRLALGVARADTVASLPPTPPQRCSAAGH
jgi:hypothetical protein